MHRFNLELSWLVVRRFGCSLVLSQKNGWQVQVQVHVDSDFSIYLLKFKHEIAIYSFNDGRLTKKHEPECAKGTNVNGLVQ